MAMFTPAQKPRGLARMIFTSHPPVWPYPTYRGKSVPGNPQKQHRHPVSGGDEVDRAYRAAKLLDLDFLDFNGLLAVLLGHDAGHLTLLGFLADGRVVLLVRGGVEIVDHFLAVFLFENRRNALGFLGQAALGADDLAFDGDFLLVLAFGARPQRQGQTQCQQRCQCRSHVTPLQNNGNSSTLPISRRAGDGGLTGRVYGLAAGYAIIKLRKIKKSKTRKTPAGPAPSLMAAWSVPPATAPGDCNHEGLRAAKLLRYRQPQAGRAARTA